jgi:DNA-binding NtrC family response regulator
MARILLIDDEPNLLSVLRTLLKAENHDVVPISDSAKAQELISTEEFDLMVTDVRMSPVSGLELLKQAKAERPSMAVIILTAFGTVQTAIEAMKLGAFDFIAKPFKLDEFIITVQRALEYSHAITENANLKAQLSTRYEMESIVAESSSMQHVCDMIRRVAPTDATVLVYGESGTGKELVARAIHRLSRRKEKNFLAVNCAALPEQLLESEMFGHVRGAFTGATSDKQGLFEAANGGTLFLDEIGSMPPAIQGKLLRVLQEKEIRRVGSNDNVAVDTRVLAATNSSLEELMNQGKFRQDLYYRLSVIPIEIKPLRERIEDILPLAYHVIRKETPEGKTPPGLDVEACSILESYPWPGNVRELENAIKHALTFVRGDRITKDVLPPKIGATPVQKQPGQGTTNLDANRGKSLKAFLRAREREYLQQVLRTMDGDKEKTAKALKISLATLYRKMPEDDESTA